MRRPLEIRATLHQLDSLGVKSMGIVAVTSLFIGMVMTIQFAFGLRRFGGVEYIPRVIILSFCRELAPTLTAVIVGGRIGSGMAAEVGAMNVTEQVDAIRALGADPAKKLVLPRVLAAIIVMPLLSVYALALGTLGAIIICAAAVRHQAEPLHQLLARGGAPRRLLRRPRQDAVLRLPHRDHRLPLRPADDGRDRGRRPLDDAHRRRRLDRDPDRGLLPHQDPHAVPGRMKHARARQVALALVVSPALVVAGLAYDAHARRAAKASEAPAIDALARRLPTSDLALSGGARWLRAISLEEPGAAFADGPASPDPDPAGAAMAPPVELWSAVARGRR